VGITLAGEREVLAFTTGERENQKAWEDLLDDLKRRGVEAVDLWITDGNQAMLNALALKFTHSRRQRCIKHKMENVLSYVPEQKREEVEPELKAIFYQKSRQSAECEKYERIYPTAVECLRRDQEACLTFYDSRRITGRQSARPMSLSDSMARSSSAPIRWPLRSVMRAAVC